MTRIASCCLALAALAACSTDKCKNVTCPTGQSCLAASGTCDCKGVSCGTGEVCSPADGKCTNLCANVKCTATATSVCDPSNGTCVDHCSGTTCPAMQHCDVHVGGCVANCTVATCPDPTTTCDPTNGNCDANCSTDGTHTGTLQGNMLCDPTMGLQCDTTSGKCIDTCALISSTCKYDQSCVAPASSCSANTPPAAGATGGACTAAADCTQSHNGTTDRCADEATYGVPGGECLEICSGKTCSSGQVGISSGTSCLCAEPCATNSECRSDLGWSCTPKSLIEGAPGSTCQALDECLASGMSESDCTGDPGAAEGEACDGTTFCKAGLFCFDIFVTDANGNPTASATCQRLVTVADCNAHVGCANATDTCFGGVFSDDTDAALCFPTCTLGAQAGPGSCDVPGYSCTPLDNQGHNGCFGRTCDVDADCVNQVANCDLADASVGENFCGKGQHCSSQTAAGTCSVVDTCTTDADCGGGTGSCDTTKHLCTPYCEQANGQCFNSCSGITDAASLAMACGSTDATRDPRVCAASGACEVACTSDEGCGASAICKDGFCVSKCWQASVVSPATGSTVEVTNEATVCGTTGATTKCEWSTGHCITPCDATHACPSDTETCDMTSHCVAKCTSNDDCVAGSDTPTCDPSSGLCVPQCTLANEATVCTPLTNADMSTTARYCDVVSGLCNTDCSLPNAPACASGQCNVGTKDSSGNYTQPSRCNQPCGISDNGATCTASPASAALYCQDASTQNGVCALKCSTANEATVCDPTGASGTKTFCDTTATGGECYPDCTTAPDSCSATQMCCGATGSAASYVGRCVDMTTGNCDPT